MIDSKCFEGLGRVRATGWTSRNVRVAVWGAVYGKTSVIYVPTHQLARYMEQTIQDVCRDNQLDYNHLRSKILVRVPETRGFRPDMVLIDNSMQTAFYDSEEINFE